MSNLPGCGCGNWWNNAPQSVCGTFETPEVEDQGRCGPRRIKITCDAPTLPVIQCDDANYEVVYQPEDVENPFSIIASLFDELCNAVTDEDGATILTVVV